MKNGIDISGVSEIVHEVHADPHQAQMRYQGRARWTQGGGAVAWTEPATIGRLKSPRLFSVPLSFAAPTAIPGHGSPPASPLDLALCGVAGCFTVSCVSGCSAKSISLEGFSLTLSGSSGGLQYRIQSRSGAAHADIQAVVDVVSRQSPNHRTICDPNVIAIPAHPDAEAKLGPEAPDTTADTPLPSVTCRWRYGTQLTAEFGLDGSRVLHIDQPKQLAGIDIGPNPQEFLLMGLAGSVVAEAIGCVTERGMAVTELEVAATGRVDVRGMFDLDGPIPVRLQDITCTLSAKCGDATAAAADAQALCLSAAARSAVAALIRRPIPVKIEVECLPGGGA